MNKRVFNDEQTNTAEFDSYCDTYSDEMNQSLAFSGQSHDFFTRVKAEYLTEIVRNPDHFEEQVSVLDVGCGHGLIHKDLLEKSRQKINLFAVDVASSVIEVAKINNPGVTYQSYDGTHLPFSNSSFDLVYAICVLHHVPPAQWLLFLEEMKRVVKKNGLVVVFEHNPLNPVTRRIVKKCPLDKNAVLLSSKNLSHLMKKIQLNTIKTRYILFTPFDKPAFQNLDRKLGWLPFGAQYFTQAKK